MFPNVLSFIKYTYEKEFIHLVLRDEKFPPDSYH